MIGQDETRRGKWIGYHGGERFGIEPSEEGLIREYSLRGLKSDQDEIFVIDEVEQVDYPSAWMV